MLHRETPARRRHQDEAKHSGSRWNLYCVPLRRLWKYLDTSLDIHNPVSCDMASLWCAEGITAGAGMGVLFFHVTSLKINWHKVPVVPAFFLSAASCLWLCQAPFVGGI